MAILPSALHSYTAAVFHIHDIIQYFAYVVGTDRWRNFNKGLITDIAEFPYVGGAFVVYVSFDQSLPLYSYHIALAE